MPNGNQKSTEKSQELSKIHPKTSFMALGGADTPAKDLTECPMGVDKAPNGSQRSTKGRQQGPKHSPKHPQRHPREGPNGGLRGPSAKDAKKDKKILQNVSWTHYLRYFGSARADPAPQQARCRLCVGGVRGEPRCQMGLVNPEAEGRH